MTCKQCGECCYTEGVKCPHLQYIGHITFCDVYPFRPKICKEWKCKK